MHGAKRFQRPRIPDYPGPGNYDARPKTPQAPTSMLKSKTERFHKHYKIKKPGFSSNKMPGPGV